MSNDAAPQPEPTKRKIVMRRKYLVDPKKQLTATAKVAALVLLLLIVINITLASISYWESQTIIAVSPDLRERVEESHTRGIILTAAISLIFFAAVVIRSIMLTHRTAGASFRVGTCLEEVGQGNFGISLKLRRKDTLRELEGPFNRMVRSLSSRERDEADDLLKIAEQVQGLSPPDQAADLGRQLVNLAESKKNRS